METNWDPNWRFYDQENYIRSVEKDFNSRAFVTVGDVYEFLDLSPWSLSEEARNEVLWTNPKLDDVILVDFNIDDISLCHNDRFNALIARVNRKFDELERRINNV